MLTELQPAELFFIQEGRDFSVAEGGGLESVVGEGTAVHLFFQAGFFLGEGFDLASEGFEFSFLVK